MVKYFRHAYFITFSIRQNKKTFILVVIKKEITKSADYKNFYTNVLIFYHNISFLYCYFFHYSFFSWYTCLFHYSAFTAINDIVWLWLWIIFISSFILSSFINWVVITSAQFAHHFILTTFPGTQQTCSRTHITTL